MDCLRKYHILVNLVLNAAFNAILLNISTLCLCEGSFVTTADKIVLLKEGYCMIFTDCCIHFLCTETLHVAYLFMVLF